MTQMPPPQYQGGAMQPHRGVLILVFGIIGLVICVIFGIVAWVMGNNDLRQIDAGLMDPNGRGLVQAGRILGMVSVGLTLLIVAFYVLIVVVAIAAGP